MTSRKMWILRLFLAATAMLPAVAQTAVPEDAAGPPEIETAPPRALEPVAIDKTIYGVLPNYRFADGNLPYEPISAHQKYGIGLRDSFEKPVYLLAGFYAGIGQLTNSNPAFGQGMRGFGQRYVRSLGDTAIGNVLTEAVFPSLMKEDPRYFFRGPRGGSMGRRARYALTRVLVTRTDSGGVRFNYSEFLGNAGAVAISNLYYPESRTVGSNLGKFALQVGTDAIANVLKEFWPDVKGRLFRKKSP